MAGRPCWWPQHGQHTKVETLTTPSCLTCSALSVLIISVGMRISPFYEKNDNDATKKNISYFLTFNDPTVPEHQVWSILVALIFKAVLEMQRSGRVDATPKNVLEFMRKRAKDSPQDMQLFMQLKYFWTMLLFGKAEHCDKIDLYFSCMHLSLPLLAVENAHNYVLIFTEALKYWATCSIAEKDLIWKYGFTLETPNSVHVGMDFGMEKYVWLVRDSTGKVKRAGSELKIETAALTRPGNQEKEGIKGCRKYKGKDLKWYDGLVFVKSMVTFEAMGAWTEDPKEKLLEPSADAVYSMQQPGERLPTELLYTDSVGTALVTQHVKSYMCSRRRLTDRKKSPLHPRDYTPFVCFLKIASFKSSTIMLSSSRLPL